MLTISVKNGKMIKIILNSGCYFHMNKNFWNLQTIFMRMAHFRPSIHQIPPEMMKNQTNKTS